MTYSTIGPPHLGWIHVTIAPGAIAPIDSGHVVELSLDHDLGDDETAGNGDHVVDHIAEQQVLAGRDLWPRDGITIHRANPAGRDQMARTIERYAGELHRVSTDDRVERQTAVRVRLTGRPTWPSRADVSPGSCQDAPMRRSTSNMVGPPSLGVCIFPFAGEQGELAEHEREPRIDRLDNISDAQLGERLGVAEVISDPPSRDSDGPRFRLLHARGHVQPVHACLARITPERTAVAYPNEEIRDPPLSVPDRLYGPVVSGHRNHGQLSISERVAGMDNAVQAHLDATDAHGLAPQRLDPRGLIIERRGILIAAVHRDEHIRRRYLIDAMPPKELSMQERVLVGVGAGHG